MKPPHVQHHNAAKPGLLAPSPPHAAPLSRVAVLALLAAAALLLLALAGVPQRLRVPLELAGGSAAASHAELAGSRGGSPPGAGGSSSPDAPSSGPSSSSSSVRSGSDGGCEAAPDATAPSPFSRSCTLLRDACVDQERVILYGPQNSTRPWQLAPSPDHAKFVFELAEPLGLVDHQYHLPPLHIRPASTAEGAAYLHGRPAFSNCTVPIVWYPFERLNNFAHLFRDNGARLLGAVQETPWAAQHGKLVLVTAEGSGLREQIAAILQPLFHVRMESWSDFSTRLPAKQVAGGAFVPADVESLAAAAAIWEGSSGGGGDDRPPLSAEGGPQRCFRHMYVCTAGAEIDIANWPTHGFGLALVEHYRAQLAAWRQQQGADPGGAPWADAAAVAAAAEAAAAVGADGAVEPAGGGGSGGSGGGARGERLLRILFQQRSGDRLLINSRELVERCNRWRYTTHAGQRLRASCAEVEMTSLLSGMAAAQEADVFIGVHGANMANAWLMRPGSAMIELQPYGFDAGAAHLQYPLFNMRDNATGVLWWVLSICDPAAFTPGEDEAAGRGNPAGYAKMRNAILRWDALDAMLQKVAEAGGDADRYRRRTWPDGQWWWWLSPGGRLTAAGPQRNDGPRWTKMRCPSEGEQAADEGEA